MAEIESLFHTQIYRAQLMAGDAPLLRRLRADCLAAATEDKAGQSWSRAHGYKGYTSYASLTGLDTRYTAFGELKTVLDRHAEAFAKASHFAAPFKAFRMNALWLNILKPEGVHSGHIHPLSVISGAFYVRVPGDAGVLRFEDPRLTQMMASPPRKPSAPKPLRSFVSLQPKAGQVLMWESWLRNEVPSNMAKQDRISVSFNYGWA
jgi:uncharacterized protein (TIGR02466 family)